MFCGNCGQFVNDSDKFCKNCGVRVTPIENKNTYNDFTNTNPIKDNNDSYQKYNENNFQSKIVVEKEDKVNVFLVILSILIPIVGLILFLTLKKETPKKAKAVGIAALISFIVGFILCIIIFNVIITSLIEDLEYIYEDFDEYDSKKLEEFFNNEFNFNEFDYDFENEYYDLEDEFDDFYENELNNKGTI